MLKILGIIACILVFTGLIFSPGARAQALTGTMMWVGLFAMLSLVALFFNRTDRDRKREGTDSITAAKFAQRIAEASEDRMREAIGDTAPKLELEGSAREGEQKDFEAFVYSVTGPGFDSYTKETGRFVQLQIRLDRRHQTKAAVILAEFKDDRVFPKLKFKHGSVDAMSKRIGSKLVAMQEKRLSASISSGAVTSL